MILMLKKLISLLLSLMVAAAFVPAAAEEATAPVLIDRINAPDAHADFAFAEDGSRCWSMQPRRARARASATCAASWASPASTG